MAEKETKNAPKDVIEAVPEELEKLGAVIEAVEDKPIEVINEVSKEKSGLAAWVPKTKLGKTVKSGEIKDFDKILKEGKRILEPQIVDSLLNLETDLILIGQAKGKFGGGKRRAWRQTQKKTQEGNVISFSAMAIAGDRKGHVGIGYGKA